MERKFSPSPFSEKLTEVVARDYPGTTEILVGFPNSWELVHRFKRGQTPLYVAGQAPSREAPRGDHFFGLPPEINRSLTTYRLYRLFEPRSVPLFHVEWNTFIGAGRVIGSRGMQVHLQPFGQAQVWQGEHHAVMWECYGNETGRGGVNWQEELATFWQVVEADIPAHTIFTQPYEPTYPDGYPDFLRRLGYTPDPELASWWRKDR